MSSRPRFRLTDAQGHEPRFEGQLVVTEFVEYILELAADEDPACLASVDRQILKPLRPGLGVLCFRNYVGRAKVLGETLEVRSPKLDEAAFDAMLRELSAMIAALPFHYATPVALEYAPSEELHPLLYHQWILLRDWVHGDHGPPLREVVEIVLHEPHRRLQSETVQVDAGQAHRLDARTIQRMASSPDDWSRLANSSSVGQTAIARRTRQPSGDFLFPHRVHTRQTSVTVDTPENQFVKYLLWGLRDLNQRFHDRVASRERSFNADLLSDCRTIEATLSALLSAPLFFDVGRMTMLPGNSMVLQRREGYRQCYQGYLRLQGGVRHPVAADDLRAILECKKVSTLYEYWTFFNLVEALRRLSGEPEPVTLPSTRDTIVSLPWSIEVSWPREGLSLTFNRTFSKEQRANGSYSVELRPDITLETPIGRFLFDAKFKVS